MTIAFLAILLVGTWTLLLAGLLRLLRQRTAPSLTDLGYAPYAASILTGGIGYALTAHFCGLRFLAYLSADGRCDATDTPDAYLAGLTVTVALTVGALITVMKLLQFNRNAA